MSAAWIAFCARCDRRLVVGREQSLDPGVNPGVRPFYRNGRFQWGEVCPACAEVFDMTPADLRRAPARCCA